MTESERLALEAERLLTQEPLLDQALMRMEAAMVDAIVNPAGSDRSRLEGAIAVNIIRDFKNVLRGYITNAKAEVAAQNRSGGGFV